jgi:hypothetical protein
MINCYIYIQGAAMTLSHHQKNQMEKLCRAVIEQRLGDISGLPKDLAAQILNVYRDFIASYLNLLRQQENKPADWIPETLCIDTELANGMCHFFSDYQHITRKFYTLNRKIERLQQIDKDKQTYLYKHTVDDILNPGHHPGLAGKENAAA